MSLNIHQKINIKGLAEQFPQITVKEFRKRIQKLKIGSSGDFERSFKATGKSDGQRIYFEMVYDYYATFTHLGVGKGIKAHDVNISRLIGHKRKPKPWMKILANQRHRLYELYYKEVGDAVVGSIKESVITSIKLF